MKKVYSEFDQETRITSVVHEDERKTVIQKTYDRQPFLEAAAEMRAETSGQKWGEMRHIGYIPPAELATMLRQDGRLDQKRVIEFLKKNEALVTFEKFLKK